MASLLCEVSNKIKIDLKNIVQCEVEYLMENRQKTAVGGWNYFPSVNEIAPDIDDLGQIIQLLMINNNQDYYNKYCKSVVEIVLNNCVDENGGIKTWIIPTKNRTKHQEKQLLYNKTKWGEGPDVEVMANFLYSLTLVKNAKFETYIKRGADYILDLQNKDGFWISRWYFGNFYGTYVCLRLLKSLNNKTDCSINITNAINYIMNSHNSDGGWGMVKDNSDPLSTSLAILSLKLYCTDEFIKEAIKSGSNYLINNIEKDKTWQAIDFILPRMNEPYKSKTITNMFVLRALL